MKSLHLRNLRKFMQHKRLALIAALVLIAGPLFGQTLAEVDRMRSAGQYKQALAALEVLKAKDSGDADVLWRIARIEVDLGETAPNKASQTAYYEKARTDAQAAVKVGPRNADAYLTLAIATGRVGLISGTKRKIELSREVKQTVDRALELNPRLGTAYHVRARWNYEVASLGFMEKAVVKVVYGGLPNASFEAAASDFKKAIQFEDSVLNHLELGRTYLKLDNDAAAKAEFNKAIAMPEADPDDPGHKATARKLLAGIK